MMTRSKSNVSDPFATALRLLTRRDRSEAELRQKLVQFGFSISAIDETIARCREYNYLDDLRYATERARSLIRNGRGSGHKINRDLHQRGIDEVTARQAMETAEQEYPADQILREQLSRRFPNFTYKTADQRERQRVISFFQRRGFSLEMIFQAIKENNS